MVCFMFCRPPSFGIDPLSWKNLNPELLISTLESTIDFRLDAIKDTLRRVTLFSFPIPVFIVLLIEVLGKMQ